ncbi:unnamed protein product, partial [Oppiella nova]
MPALGLGTGGYGSGGPPQGQQMVGIIDEAIDIGYRHIDTASGYRNEEAVGQAINKSIANGCVKREDLFVTTKVFYEVPHVHDIPGHTLSSVRLSLNKLALDYVDLMLFHHPSNDPAVNAQVWLGLERALSEGLVKGIGVSNFNANQLERLLSAAQVVPAVNQIESHPKCSQRDLIEVCRRYGIQVTAYSPLGAGSLVRNESIATIGRTYGKSAAQVMIRWQIQRGLAV